MKTIEICDLKKVYRTKVKKRGLMGGFRSIFTPSYKITEALRGIDFSLEQGHAIGFIGPNGSGKSTTIKILTGILHPTSGMVSVMGLEPSLARQRLSCQIGVMFGQRSQLLLHLPPADSFMLLGSIFDLSPARVRERVRELSAKLGLDDILHTPTRKLSLGQRMRCELAATLLHRPKLLLLDEPSIGLDVVAKQSFRNLVKDLLKHEGLSLVLASHDMGDIESVCPQVVLINSGSIVFDGSLRTLKSKYVGSKTINVQYVNELGGAGLSDMKTSAGFKIVASTDTSVSCLLDRKSGSIGSVIAQLANLGEIHDISVADESLEDIVGRIYSMAGRNGDAVV